jgi:carboxyl-terminal processing protease
VVYGGGGIMPDIYVPIDTSGYTPYYYDLNAKGVINEFVFKYLALNSTRYKKIDQLLSDFKLTPSGYQQLKQMAADQGVIGNETQTALSRNLIETDLKALLARYFFGDEGFYKALNAEDRVIARSMEVLK